MANIIKQTDDTTHFLSSCSTPAETVNSLNDFPISQTYLYMLYKVNEWLFDIDKVLL